jgi:hypothetical protein
MTIYSIGNRITYKLSGASKQGTIRAITREKQYASTIADYMSLEKLNTNTAMGPFIYKIDVEPDGTTDKHYDRIGVYDIEGIINGGRRKSRKLRKTRCRKNTRSNRR